MRIIEIVATKMSDFKVKNLKCAKFDFEWGSAPDPTVKLIALPRPLAAFKGPISRGREAGEGKVKEMDKRFPLGSSDPPRM